MAIITNCINLFPRVADTKQSKVSDIAEPELETVSLRPPARCIIDYALFTVCSSSTNCSSARYVSAANIVCRNADVLGTKIVSLNHTLLRFILLIKTLIVHNINVSTYISFHIV
jgi:hypothetical protein